MATLPDPPYDDSYEEEQRWQIEAKRSRNMLLAFCALLGLIALMLRFFVF